MSLINRVTVLDNGVTVSTIKMQDSKKSAFQIVIDGGQASSTAGIAHFTEHMLFQGTKTRTQEELEASFKALGFGNINGSTGILASLYPSYSSNPYTCSEKAFYPALEIIMDIIANPRFLESGFDVNLFEGERNRIFEEEKTSRATRADFFKWQAALFPETYRARSGIGNRENIAEISLQQIIDYYNSSYTGKRIFVFAAGQIDHDKTVNISNKYLGKLRPGTPFAVPTLIAAPAEVNTPKLLDIEGIDLWIETFEKLSRYTKNLSKLMPNKDGKISTLLKSYPSLLNTFKQFANNSSRQVDFHLVWPGARCPIKEETLSVITAVGLLDTMLYEEGVVNNKIVYGINANNMSDRDTGTATISSKFDPRKFSAILELISNTLSDLVASPPKNILKTIQHGREQFWETYEPTAASLTARIRDSIMQEGRYVTDDEHFERVCQITLDVVRTAAERIFVPEKTAVYSHGTAPTRDEIIRRLFKDHPKL